MLGKARHALAEQRTKGREKLFTGSPFCFCFHDKGFRHQSVQTGVRKPPSQNNFSSPSGLLVFFCFCCCCLFVCFVVVVFGGVNTFLGGGGGGAHFFFRLGHQDQDKMM